MNGSIDFSAITVGIASFFRRFHTILFFLVVSIGLFAAITLLLGIISLSSTTATSSSQTVNGGFDEDTINRLKQSSGEVTPGARKSPFAE